MSINSITELKDVATLGDLRATNHLRIRGKLGTATRAEFMATLREAFREEEHPGI